MTPSLLLAKWIGLYLIIMCGICLLRRDYVVSLGLEFVANRGLLALSGAFTLILGLGVVLSHNIWTLDYRGIITGFGYLMVMAGIVRFGWPDQLKGTATSIIRSSVYWPMIVLMGALGAYLAWVGFSF